MTSGVADEQRMETMTPISVAVAQFVAVTLRASMETKVTYRCALVRFGAWLTDYHVGLHRQRSLVCAGNEQAPVAAVTVAAITSYLTFLTARGLSAATVRKDRAAINRFVRYLHDLQLIDGTEILRIESRRDDNEETVRVALDVAGWHAVQAAARGRLAPDACEGSTLALAARDHAIIMLLGGCGLRNGETRCLARDAIGARPGSDRVWLTIGGGRSRTFPLPADVAAALGIWEQHRPAEVDEHLLMFPRLGRATRDGRYPRAATTSSEGAMTAAALRQAVARIMRRAGVPDDLCHPRVLRLTFAALYMGRDGARLKHLQTLLGHASVESTANDLHAVVYRYEGRARAC